MEFRFIPLHDALTPSAQIDLENVLHRLPDVNSALVAGGWIGGGFARHLLLDRPSHVYFIPVNSRTQSGDIDVFFSSVSQAQAVIPSYASPSRAKFAKEIRSGNVKVQFVDDPGLIKPTIVESLSRFDIVNCSVAITREFAIIPDGWHELEESKLLRIGRNDHPFLGGRILKYLEQRGLEGLTEDSYEQLTGWLAHAANDFNEGGWNENHVLGVQGHVKRLRAMGLVRREDLIFFIRKWKQIINLDEGLDYGQSQFYTVDWALNEMGGGLENGAAQL